MISVEKIRAISSIVCKDIVLDPEVESGWPYRFTYTIYEDRETDMQNEFQNILKSMEKYIKASASDGHKSLHFQFDYNINDSYFCKRIVIGVYIILFNNRYDVAVSEEHTLKFNPNHASEIDDAIIASYGDYCQDRRMIDLFIKW